MVAPKQTARLVHTDHVRLDGGTQRRERLDDAALADYTAAALADADFPPLDVVEDEEGNLWLWDGFHRYQAFTLAGLAEVNVRITPGTLDDARWLSLGANKDHGVRMKPGEKQAIIRAAILARPDQSNGAIAAHVGSTPQYVGRIRLQLETGSSCEPRTGLDGRTRKMPTKPAVPGAHSAHLGVDDPPFDPDPLPEGEEVLDAPEIPFVEPTPAREPGDDSEAIAEEEAREKARPKPGKVLYDWKPFDAAFGSLVREIDKLGGAYGAKESPDANALRSDLKLFRECFQGWHAKLAKKARAAS